MPTSKIWNNAKLIHQKAKQSRYLGELLLNLGFNKNSSSVRKKLKKFIAKHKIDISHFRFMIVKDRWLKKHVQEAVVTSISFNETLIKLQLVPKSGNYNTLKKYIEKYGISTAHFSQKEAERRTKQRNGTERTIPLEEILQGKRPGYRNTYTLKRRMIKAGLLEEKCYKCESREWMSEKISLDLDHINGINNDHRKENLRLLCPNCHALTPTYKAKNNKRYAAVAEGVLRALV